MAMIIGITGTLGAGKGTVVDYLLRHKGFKHYSVRAFLIREIVRLHKTVDRDSMVETANSLRARHGASFIVENLYEQASSDGGNAIIESIRTPGEIAALRMRKSFCLLAVDAPKEIRYQRIRERNSETDQISYETFLSNEAREMHSEDPNKQNISACIQQADYIVSNEGSIAELHEKIEIFYQFLSKPDTHA